MITEEEKKAILELNTLYTQKEMSVKYAKIDNRMTAFKQQLDKEVNNWKTLLNLITKLQKELEKKDKVIDYIFEYLTDTEWDNCCIECEQLHSCPQDYDALLECIKQYFINKVEAEDE